MKIFTVEGTMVGDYKKLSRTDSNRSVLIGTINYGHRTVIPMNRPVVTVPSRGLGTRFLVAEPAWILSGDNRLSTILPYARRIAETFNMVVVVLTDASLSSSQQPFNRPQFTESWLAPPIDQSEVPEGAKPYDWNPTTGLAPFMAAVLDIETKLGL